MSLVQAHKGDTPPLFVCVYVWEPLRRKAIKFQADFEIGYSILNTLIRYYDGM